MERIIFADVTTHPIVEMANIVRAINDESTMLQTTEEDMQRSYAQRMSVVMLDGQQVIGHTRYIPLLDQTLKNALGLPEQFPQIWEIGGVITHPDYRGNGYNKHLWQHLAQLYRSDLDQGQLLALGTTKHIGILQVLPKLDQIGLDFRACHHFEFPMVSPFTCICSGSFGQGFHITDHCQSRIGREHGEALKNRAAVPHQPDGLMKCSMFVSSLPLAEQVNQDLQRYFGNPYNLVQSLRQFNYFS